MSEEELEEKLIELEEKKEEAKMWAEVFERSFDSITEEIKREQDPIKKQELEKTREEVRALWQHQLDRISYYNHEIRRIRQILYGEQK